MTNEKPATLDYCASNATLVMLAPVAQGSAATQVFVFEAR
jgi:hypothetical protein